MINSGISLSLAMCFMLFIYAPLEIYCYNKDEFWFDIYFLLPILLVIFLITLVISLLIFFALNLISNKAYKVAVVLGFIAYISSYIQGNYMVGNLPPLDGMKVDWNKYSNQRIGTIILWLIVIMLTAILIKKFKSDVFIKAVRVISLCMTGMLLITITCVFIANNGAENKPGLFVTKEKQYNMSNDENFIMLVVDAVDATAFNELFNEHDEYGSVLSDFTYYQNTMSTYPYTQHSIPFILSGEWYENKTSFTDYNVNAYKNSPLFNELKKRNYQLGLYELETPMSDDSIKCFENIKDVGNLEFSFKDYAKFSKLIIKLVGFKYAPFDLKGQCVVDTADFRSFINIVLRDVYDWANGAFYNDSLSENIELTDSKCFKFYHIEGAHVPFDYDENLNIVENGTYLMKIESTMTVVKAYLEKLKAADVYDNSVIMIMSDHGFNGDDSIGRQNPVLFIKGKNEKHNIMQNSDAPVSYEDLQEAYIRLLDGKDSTEVFNYKDGDYRERRYLFYYISKENHMEEYIQKGHARDESTLISTGISYDYDR